MATSKLDKSARRAPSRQARRESSPAGAENAGPDLQSAMHASQPASPESILQLQRAVGNRAVQRLLQRKAIVGPADDALEREADQTARRVMSPQAGAIARTVQQTSGAAGVVQASRRIQRGFFGKLFGGDAADQAPKPNWQIGYFLGSQQLTRDTAVAPYHSVEVDFERAAAPDKVWAKSGSVEGEVQKSKVIKGSPPTIGSGAFMLADAEMDDSPVASQDNTKAEFHPFMGHPVQSGAQIKTNPAILDRTGRAVLAESAGIKGYLPKKRVAKGNKPAINESAYSVGPQQLKGVVSDDGFNVAAGPGAIGAPVPQHTEIKINSTAASVGGNSAWANHDNNTGVLPKTSLIKGTPEDPSAISTQMHLKSGMIIGTRAHLHAPLPETKDYKYQVNENELLGSKIVEGVTVLVNPNLKDESGKWVRASYRGFTGFVRADKLENGAAPGSAPPTLDKTKIGTTGSFTQTQDGSEKAAEIGESVTESIGGGLDPMAGALDLEKLKQNDSGGLFSGGSYKDKDGSDTTSGFGHKSRLDATVGVSDSIAGILGMVKGVRTWKESQSKMDKAGALLEGAEGLSKLTSGVTKATDSIGKAQGHTKGLGKSISNGKGLNGGEDITQSDLAGKITGTIGDGIGAIKELFGIVKSSYDLYEESEKGALSSGEKFKGGMGIVLGTLKGAAAIVKVVKGILEITSGGVSAALSATLPFLSTAVSIARVTMKAYDAIMAGASIELMRAQREDFKAKYKDANQIGAEQREKLSYFSSKYKTSFKVDPAKLEQRKTFLTLWIAAPPTGKPPVPTGMTAPESDQKAKQELADIKEYELSGEMKYINQKRRTRAGIQIGVELVKIAGDVATLSGVGASAGIPLKAIAAGTEVGMVGARTFKQFGRDQGWSGFNQDKTTQKKMARRDADAKLIMEMVAALDASQPAQCRRVQTYIEAAGVDLNALYRLSPDAAQQFELLVKSMAKRE